MRHGKEAARRASLLGLGAVDAVLILDEDLPLPAPSTTTTTTVASPYSRAALSSALKSLLVLPLLARSVPSGGAGGGSCGGRQRVVTVVRFLTEGTVEEALEERGAGAGIGGLEVCVLCSPEVCVTLRCVSYSLRRLSFLAGEVCAATAYYAYNQ